MLQAAAHQAHRACFFFDSLCGLVLLPNGRPRFFPVPPSTAAALPAPVSTFRCLRTGSRDATSARAAERSSALSGLRSCVASLFAVAM